MHNFSIQKAAFTSALQSWQLELGAEQVALLQRYLELLYHRNEEMNLTAVPAEEAWFELVVDSLLPLRWMKLEGRLIDIGTGAGLPGVPLAIACPELQVTLLDSLKKRCTFLEEVSAELELSNVTVHWGRSEEFSKDATGRESFDFVTSKAVAELRTLLELGAGLPKVGGKFLCYKSNRADEELAAAGAAMSELHLELENRHDMSPQPELGDYGAKQRSLLSFVKTASLSERYPRSTQAIKKRPLS